MIIVTGGAGFIGSALVWALNKRGVSDILIVDSIDDDEQEHNIGHLLYEEIISGDEFREKLREGFYDSKGVTAILHMGAISATTETDWDKLQYNNVDFSQEVIRWCVDRGVRCVYASSGATYGLGEKGYIDDHELFDALEPLNLYGKSKLLVDIWARDAEYLDQVVGLRYFNVFGPNEYHKGSMKSVIAKKFDDVAKGLPITLFASDNPEYPDGGQMRDFVYIKDVVDATLFFMDEISANGVFNVGAGKARTWNDVARAMFLAVKKDPVIEYVPMPEELTDKYQYYTQADISKLRDAGFGKEFMSLEDSVVEYVSEYLLPHKHLED